MHIHWRPFKGKKNRYACLYEPAYTSQGRLYSHLVVYLGKDPVAKVEKLYREGRLTLEQVLSISERKLPEMAELKETLRKEVLSSGTQEKRNQPDQRRFVSTG